MPLNEQETRTILIDPILRDKGYVDRRWLKCETPAPVEPTGFKGRRKAGAGRTDYLFCVQVGAMPKPLPVAVFEAKKEDQDPLKGMQQAMKYSECEKFEVKYCFSSNGHLYGEYDHFTQLQSGTFPLTDFQTHDELTLKIRGFSLTALTQKCCLWRIVYPGISIATIRMQPSGLRLRKL